MDKASANSAAWRMKRTLGVLALLFALVTFGTGSFRAFCHVVLH